MSYTSEHIWVCGVIFGLFKLIWRLFVALFIIALIWACLIKVGCVSKPQPPSPTEQKQTITFDTP